jgi:hypothetical protein
VVTKNSIENTPNYVQEPIPLWKINHLNKNVKINSLIAISNIRLSAQKMQYQKFFINEFITDKF